MHPTYDPSTGVMHLGGDPDNLTGPAALAFALRARANLSVRVRRCGRGRLHVKWRCPYCGARWQGTVRRGQVQEVWLPHEDGCPVPTDEALLAALRGS